MEIIYRLHEVLNYGGFFGGDTVTVTAHASDKPEAEETLTIDQSALANVSDRYQIAGGMALALLFEGDRVAAARLVGAREREVLRRAVVATNEPLDAPRIFAHHCPRCDLWILDEPRDGRCGVEGHPFIE